MSTVRPCISDLVFVAVLLLSSAAAANHAQFPISAAMPVRSHFSVKAFATHSAVVRNEGENQVMLRLQPDARVEVPFAFVMNTRNARVRVASATSIDLTIDVKPENTECNWMHAPVQAADGRVVSIMTECPIAHQQSGALILIAGPAETSVTLEFEPATH